MAKYKDPNSWSYGGVRRRDFRNGGVDEDDFEIEFYYQKKVGTHVPRGFCAKEPENKCAEFYWKPRWTSRPDERGYSKTYGSFFCKKCHRVDWRRWMHYTVEYHPSHDKRRTTSRLV